MQIGDVVRMTSASILVSDPESKDWLRLSYKAQASKVMVFLLLGEEPRSGANPLNVIDRLYAMGWSHPEHRPSIEELAEGASGG